jgi:hypothetical protein
MLCTGGRIESVNSFGQAIKSRVIVMEIANIDRSWVMWRGDADGEGP